MRPHYTPTLKKRTALVRALKEVFRRHRSQPIERVINLINPVLRGWVNYFAVGHSSECFSFIKDWVEKKVRRHLAHAAAAVGRRPVQAPDCRLRPVSGLARPPPERACAGRAKPGSVGRCRTILTTPHWRGASTLLARASIASGQQVPTYLWFHDERNSRGE